MDVYPHYFLSPTQTSYVLEDGEAITFPPGRFLYISSTALHVTSVHLSPQQSGIPKDEAFDLTLQIENLLRSAELQENVRRRTPREEAEHILHKLPRHYPVRVNLYQYTRGQTIFIVEIAMFGPDNFVVTVKITNMEINIFWTDAAAKIAEQKYGVKEYPTERINAEEYMLKLKEFGYLNGE